MISIAQDHLDAISAAVKASAHGVKRALHPANPADAAAIGAFLALSGKTPGTHPALHEDIARLAQGKAGAADHDGQVLNIVDQGRDPQGRATARVWHHDTEGAFTSGSLALVLDADTRKPLALGFANKVGGGLTPAATRSESAQPATGRITTVGFYHSQSRVDAAPKFGMVTQTLAVAADNMGVVPNPTAPVISVPGNTAIKIGYARPDPSYDCDYNYTQATSTAAMPPLLVPFTGTVNVQQQLANLDVNGHFTTGFSYASQLYSMTSRGYTELIAGQPITQWITGSGPVVTWNFPFVAGMNYANPNPGVPVSLMYAYMSAADSAVPTAFNFQFTIPVNNPVAPTVVCAVCSVDWPDRPTQNCKQIPDLEFWWHCLAEGTQVTLADGSKLPVEKIDNTRRVRTGHADGTLGVEATTRGKHLVSEGGESALGVYTLTTAKGRTLVLTGGHPVATESGLIAASDLSAGMTLRADDGPDQVKSCEPTVSDAVFANLKLVDRVDRAKGLGGTVGTFIANGIVVGDFASMTQTHYNNTHSLDYMAPRMPERLHADYASTLSHIARDNAKYGGRY